MKNNLLLIAKMQKTIDTILRPHVPSHGKIALIDFPNYANVGDSAIWLGQTKYFDNYHHIKPSYISAQHNFDPVEMQNAIGEDGVIFISGGGNFGDLWKSHQIFREHVIQKFPSRKIVQLPQSIHFDSSTALKRAADIINAHSDFTLLVRDEASLRIAQDNFQCKIELCPDTAFCLGPLRPPALPSCSQLMLLRTDKERVDSAVAIDSTRSVDWINDDKNQYPSKIDKIRNIFYAFLPCARTKAEARLDEYHRISSSRLNRGLSLLSSAEEVISDRLHAYILSLLLGIPCRPLDNSYGKINNFIKTWAENEEVKLNERPTMSV